MTTRWDDELGMLVSDPKGARAQKQEREELLQAAITARDALLNCEPIQDAAAIALNELIPAIRKAEGAA